MSPLRLKSMLLLVYVMEVSRVLAIGGNVRAAQQLQGACLGVANNIAESCAAQSRRAWRDTVFGIADEIGKMLSASIRTAYRRSNT